jgi:cytochrome c oxidase accessory protein FixG
MNQDGSRRWIRPKPSKGRYDARRRITAWTLMIVFTALPHLRVGGKPAMLFDIPRREFSFFGSTFLPTDTFLLMLLLFSIFVGIFLVTALWGRVWCGWACPQTVYMEYLYRPLERLIEGGRVRTLKMDREGPNGRRILKHVVFLFVSAFLAHTFLAYFVGVEALSRWMRGSPAEHPAAFALMLGTTLLMFFDFGWFREQTCIVACPYGRFQSVLLDRQSLIVGYDTGRGEPRAKRRGKTKAEGAGDCVDCGLCVSTCPTGIDIRDGLQMECIHCTQCIDACDAVMDKVGSPRGLIRYTSEEELETGSRRFLRPRLVVYSSILLLMFGGLVTSLAGKSSADVTLLRGLGSPFSVLDNGRVSNQIRVKVANRADSERAFTIALVGNDELGLIAPENPLVVDAQGSAMTAAFITAPASAFVAGEALVRLRIDDGQGFSTEIEYRLLGPTSRSTP